MKKLSLVLIVAFLICHFTYQFLQNGKKKFNVMNCTQLDEVINGNKQFDILFVGSSRTQTQINPCIIDSITGLTSFNAGRAGANSLEVKMLLEAFLTKHKKPSFVVYNIDHRVTSNIKKIPNPSLYLLYLNNQKVIEGLSTTYPKILILKYIPFTRMFFVDDYFRHTALQGYFSKTEIVKGVNYCRGHESNTNDSIKSIDLSDESLITNPDISQVESIMKICKKNNIQLIFHYAPILFYKNKPSSNQKIPKIEDLAINEEIPFFKLDTLQSFSQKDFFDIAHLNKSGSEKYSRLFGAEIKKYIGTK
jgi:hypothetical protein